MILWRVTTSYLCAGIVTEGETIVTTAPILRWAKGKTIAELRAWLRRRNGKLEMVEKSIPNAGKKEHAK